MLVTKGGSSGQNSSLCSTCPLLTRVKAVQCWIWAASTLLKAMGRTCGKWQQFVGGNLEYTWYEDRQCRETGHNYRKTRQSSIIIDEFEHRLHLLYVGRGKMCKKNKKERQKNETRFKHWTRYAKDVSSTTHFWPAYTLSVCGNIRRTGERTSISKGVSSISVPSYGNGQNSGTNITKHLGSIGLLFCVLPTTPSVVWPRYVERGRWVRCWLGGQLLFFWSDFSLY